MGGIESTVALVSESVKHFKVDKLPVYINSKHSLSYTVLVTKLSNSRSHMNASIAIMYTEKCKL